MKHPFIKSLSDATLCMLCKHTVIDHKELATCDGCNQVSDCEIFGKLDNPRALLLCPTCTEREIAANDLTINKTKILIENPPFASLATPRLVTGSNDIVMQARGIDNQIGYNGDVFNAATIAINDLKVAILSDESIGTKQEREFRFQNEVATRLEHLKSVVFELDDKKHKAITEQIALRESLREFASSLREEIRERIKLSDANYQPHNIIKAPKITKPKVTPMDRLIESFMLLHDCSREEAVNIITKGKSQ